MVLLPMMTHTVNLGLGISRLNFLTPFRCVPEKEQLLKSKHFPVSKNKMLATLQPPVPRSGPSQDKQ